MEERLRIEGRVVVITGSGHREAPWRLAEAYRRLREAQSRPESGVQTRPERVPDVPILQEAQA